MSTDAQELTAATDADGLPDAVASRIQAGTHGVLDAASDAETAGEPVDVRETFATMAARPSPSGVDEGAAARLTAAPERGDSADRNPAPCAPTVGFDSGVGAVDVASPTDSQSHFARAVEMVGRLARGGPDDERSRESGPSSARALAYDAAVQPTSQGPEIQAHSAVQANDTAAVPREVAEQVVSQIVSSLKMQWKDGVGEARLHLRPDALGAVSVALRVENGGVTAVVQADSPQVQDWVLQHQQSLRQQMEAAGLRLDELTVSPDDRGQQNPPDAPPEQRRRPRRSYEDEDTPRFELLA